MMKNDGLSPREHFNRRVTDIGTAMLDVQMQMAGFILELLEFFDDYSADIELSIPHQKNDVFENIEVKKIYYNREDEVLRVSLHGINEDLEWNELNIIAQDLITTFLHMKYMADDIFGKIS
jgi:hypothetical protein